MKKTLISITLILLLSLSITNISFAENTPTPPSIFLNGNELHTSQPPIIENGRILLPMRDLFESFNQSVYWNPNDNSVTSGDVWLQIDNPVALVKGKEIKLDVPAKLVNNKTYVPLRFISESFGKYIKFDENANRINISDNPITVNTNSVVNPTINNSTEKQIENADIEFMKEYKKIVDKFKIQAELFYEISQRNLSYNVSTEYKKLENDINNLQQELNNLICPNKYKQGKQYLTQTFDDFKNIVHYYQLEVKSIGNIELFEQYKKHISIYIEAYKKDVDKVNQFLSENL